MLPTRFRAMFQVSALGAGCVLACACGDDEPAEKAGAANASDAGTAGKESQAGSAGKAGSGSAGKASAAGKAAGGNGASNAGSSGEPRDAGAIDFGEDTMPVTIRFAAKLGDQAFKCGEQYAKQGKSGTTVTPADLRFYVQDVKLIGKDGRDVPVQLDTRAPFQSAEVALLDFEDATGSCSGDAQTNDTITGRVAKGEYNAIRFTNGVPMALNHSDPNKFPTPLKSPGMSWNWLLGLRFMKAELQVDEVAPTQGADAGIVLSGGALHLGSTACSGNPAAGQISCKKPNRNSVKLSDFELDTSVIVLDVAKIFDESDLATGAECHAATPSCDSMFRSLGVDYASGSAAATQSAYHLQTR